MRHGTDDVESGKIGHQIGRGRGQPVRLLHAAMAANPRKSSAKLPMTKSENAKTADISGEENDENRSASDGNDQKLKDDKIQRHKHPAIRAIENGRETYNSAANTPIAIKNVFTTSVPLTQKICRQ